MELTLGELRERDYKQAVRFVIGILKLIRKIFPGSENIRKKEEWIVKIISNIICTFFDSVRQQKLIFEVKRITVIPY